MKQLLFCFLICCIFINFSFSSDDPPQRLFEFNYIAFRVDGLIVSITPKYGKVYGQIDAMEVAWSTAKVDSTGKVLLFSDKTLIPVKGSLRASYFQAKSVFMDKVRDLQNLFEDQFLPPEEKQRMQKK